MRKRRNWLKTSIAMLTLVATVLETGFTSVSTLAAEITTEDGIVVNNDAVEDVDAQAPADDELTINVEPESDRAVEDAYEEDGYSDAGSEDAATEETFEEAEELKEGTLDVTDSGISGSGYDEISVYVNTENLSYRKSFRIEFTGSDSAMYPTVINDDLYKTNDGRYDFDNLGGSDFTIRATSEDKVILSYRYNSDGYPEIVVENEPVEKVLNKKTISFEDGTEVPAITGEGFESVKLSFNTEELSDKASFKLVVDTEAEAKVDGEDATKGIKGLDNKLQSLVIEDLDEEPFTAYILTDDEELEIQTVADVESVEDGEAAFTVDNLDVKRVYEFEDAKIKVTATLEKPDAIPDDAFFCVTPLTEEEAEKYLEALNKDKDVENGDVLATAENTLLYDIGFYTDDTKSEEIEPEEGSVTISIEFKKDQLTEEIGAENSEDITVTHITEEGNNIETEVVADTEASVEEGTLEFTTESFSLYAIQYGGALKFKPGTAVDFKAALGDNANYGLVANSIKMVGHSETNFATKVLDGNVGMNSCKNNGGGTGYTYIGEYLGSYFKLTDNGNSGNVVIYTTPEAAAKFGYNNAQDGTLVDTTSYSQDDINNLVKDLITEATTNSNSLYSETNYYDFSEFKDKINTNPGDKMYVLDLKSLGSGKGTYYFKFANGEFGDWASNTNGLKIKITKDQTVVFNIPDTNVNLKQNIGLVIDNKESNPSGSNNEMAQHLIYNMPNAKTVTFNGNVDGVFLCPKASVTVNETSGGWLVADTIPQVGGAEWHATWPGIPTTETEKKEYEFKVTKIFEDKIVGTETSHWPKEGFEFTIEEYKKLSTDRWNSPNSGAPMPADKKIVITKGEDGRTNIGSFGKIYFDAKEYFTKAKRNGAASSVYQTGVWPCIEGYCLNYMYIIKETIPAGAVEYRDQNGNITYYNDYLANNARKVKYYEKDGVIYDAEPWTLKLWVNVGLVHTPKQNVTKYEISVNAQVKEDHASGCQAEPGHPITFTNKYEGPVEIPVTLEGIKYVNNSTENIPDGKFEFSLFEYKGSNTWGSTILKAENKGSAVKFDPITLKFGKGTKNEWDKSIYYFLIQETRCDAPYTPDGSSTIAKVIITKGNNGQYSTSVEYYRFKKGQEINVTKAMNGDSSFKYSCTKFDFWNTYSATGETTIGGTKYMEGRELKEGEYSFSLYEVKLGENGQPVKGADGKDVETFIETVTNGEVSPNGEKKYKADFGFTKLSYELKDVGKHLYRVREVVGSEPNVEYDQLVKEVTVTVAVPANYSSDQLTVTRVPEDGKVSFTNTYNPPEGGITFKATKAAASEKVTGNFTFRLTKPDGTTEDKTVPVGGTAVFDPIVYTEADNDKTYEYKIQEVIPSDDKKIPGVVYDDRVYTATVVVKDNGTKVEGKHVFDTTVTGGFDKETAVTNLTIAQFNDPKNPIFVNDYNTKNGKDFIEGNKRLSGKALTSGQFQFTLEDINDDSLKANYTASLPETIENDIDGYFRFQDIEFNQPGDYKFRVSENRAFNTDEEVIYTDHYYVVNIHVTDRYTDNDGKVHYYDELQCTQSLEEYVEAVPYTIDPATDTKTTATPSEILFINKSYGPGEAVIEASKLFNGQAPGNRVFKFRLMDADGNTVKVNGVDQIKPNNANGLVQFDKIGYKLSDLHGKDTETVTYYIEETDIPGTPDRENNDFYIYQGVKYDLRKHEVTVTLTKDETTTPWSVNAAVSYETDKAPVFENEYSAKGEYNLLGEKILRGRDFKEGDSFKFELYGAGNLNKPLAVEELTQKFTWGNKSGKGTFEFKADKYPSFLKFEKTTTDTWDQQEYGFRLYEVGSGDKVKNDNRYFEIKLVVKDNGDGKLVVTDTITPVEVTETGAENKLENFHTIVEGVETEPYKVTFTNTYVENGSTFFEANKVVKDVEDNTIPIGDKTFNFELQDKDGNRVGAVKSNDGTGKVTFDPINYTREQAAQKTILYSIHETSEAGEGYAPDTNVFIAQATLSVDDSDPENVKVNATPSYFNATKVDSAADADVTVDFGKGVVGYYKKGASTGTASVTFTNVYTATGDVIIPVTKILVGRDMSENEFSASLYDNADASNVPYDTVSFPASKDGKPVTVDFKKIEYKLSDLGGASTAKKYYTIVEKAEGTVDGVKDGVKYVDYQYRVVVTLTDNHDGTIGTSWVAYEDGTTYTERTWWQRFVDGITLTNRDHNTTFTNYYNAVGKLELSAKKVLYGRTMGENDEFKFTLTKPDGTTITKSTKDPDAIVTEDGYIKVVFDTITYYRNDINDPTQDYVVTGAASKDYEYTIVEEFKGQTINGLTYSNDEYKIKVTVADDTKGKLGVSGSINGTPKWTAAEMVLENGTYVAKPEAVEFTNIYVPDSIDVVLGGSKLLSGRDLKEDDVFTFRLKKADNSTKAFTQQDVSQLAEKTNNSGKFKFNAITYTPDDLADTRDEKGNILTYLPYKAFKYAVVELDDKGNELPSGNAEYVANGIKYDNAVYTVTVVVVNNNGVLSASVYDGDQDDATVARLAKGEKVDGVTLYSIDEKTGAYGVASFTNVYNAAGTVTIPARKVVYGRTTEDEFTFKITSDKEGNDVLRTLTVKGDGVAADFLADECKAENATEKYTFKYSLADKGEHTYYISEVVPDDKDKKAYYTYSDTVYKAVVTVGDNEDGTLEAKAVYSVENKGNLPEDQIGKEALYLGSSLQFINEYNATGTTIVTGKKQLNIKVDGKDVDVLTVLPDHELPEFTFRLMDSDSNVLAETQSTDPNGDFYFNRKTGEFAFDFAKVGIEFTLDHVGKDIRYKVVEVAPANYDPNALIGMKYDTTEYEVVVKVEDKADNDKDGSLIVTTSVPQMDVKDLGAKKTWFDKIRSFFGVEGKKPDILVINDYNSFGIIDPPVITKTLMGRELQRGEFSFKITGSYKGTAEELLSKGTLTALNSNQKGKDTNVQNGYAPDGSMRHFVQNPITGEVLVDADLDPGELFVGDINYYWDDLYKAKKFDEDGNLYDDFIYKAAEIIPSDSKDGNVEYTGLELYLFVHAVDKLDGNIETTGHGENGKLIWEVVDKDENGNAYLREVKEDDVGSGFVNKFKAKGSIDIHGTKEVKNGIREMNKDDEGKFTFTITDIENYKKAEAAGEDTSKFVAEVTNTADNSNNGRPTLIDFTSDKVSFLNYEWGYGEDPLDESDDVDDTGIHTYRIEEKKFDDKINGLSWDDRYYIVTVNVVLPKVKDAKGNEVYDKKSPLIPTITDVKRYLANGQLDDTFKFAPEAKVKFRFENPFEAFADIEFAGRKIVKNVGTDAEVKEDLTGKYGFELIDQVPNAAVGTGPVIASAYTDKDGNYVIKPKKDGKAHFFDQDDLKDVKDPYGEGKEYHFSIKEILPPNGKWVDNYHYEYGGVIYDTDTISITVNLHYDANNELIPEVKGIGRAVVHGGGVMQYRPENMKDLNYKNRIKGLDFTNKVRDYYKRGGKKIWRDSIANDLDHPDVTINLLRNGVKVATAVAKSPDWKYFFDKDQNGQPLPVCDVRGKAYDYTLEEVPIPGYDTSTRLNEDGSIDFINTKGDIMIKKINADTGEDLAGATLAIYDGSSKIEEWVSEIGAHVVTAKLTAGKTYTLRELSAPEGFELASDVSFVAPSDGGSVTVTMSDKPIVGSVKLTKRDAATREALAGAEFALYKEDGTRIYASGTNGSYRASRSTSNGIFAVDSTGSLTIADLPYGTYYFVETKAPTGYSLSTERLGFSIVKSGELVEVTFLNPKATGSVRLRKVSSTGVGSLAGAEFELYAKTPRTAGQAAASTIFRDAYYRVDSYRTNSLGEIYVTDLPWDDYYFIEVKAPDGYELRKDVNGDDIVYTFSINAATARTTIDLGGITNDEITPPPTPTPTPTGAVLGERVQRGGVVNGVLGVRAKPTSGVLGERVGPVTGDASNIILWLLLLVACAATIVATVVTGKKKKAAK